MEAIQIISQDLFDKVRSRFSNLEMGDKTGAVTIDPAQARFFDFDFVIEGNNLGRVSISLGDLGSLKVYYSQGITENRDDPVRRMWYGFLREMRYFAKRRLLRFDTRDIAKTNLDKNDFKHLAATQGPKEQDMNTMNENKKTRQRVSENASRQEMENLAETMTLDQFCSVYGDDDWVVKFWHDVNSEQGVSEDMDSLTFWKQQAQKAGGSDKIDWHAIGVEHGRQGINLNPPYGAGARAVTLYGKGLDAGQKDMAEGLQEGRWNNKSSRKTSRAVQGKTEVIVRHAHAVDEEYAGSRSQRKNIKAIFIQNKEGERFKYPFIHTAGAFAMAQHVDHGGTPHDPAGKAIIGMSEQIAQLGEFQRKVQHASLHDDATGITERAIGRLHELKSQIAALGRCSHYESWMEEFNEEDMMNDGLTMDEVTMEQYKQTFTQSSFQEELAGYFPLLHRIMSEVNQVDLADYVQEERSETKDETGRVVSWKDEGEWKASSKKDGRGRVANLSDKARRETEKMSKEKSPAQSIDAFEDWAEATEQGRLTDDQIALMKQALEELPQDQSGPELKLGPDGQTAWQFFNELGIEDSDLEDKFKDMANVDAETNALEVFKLWATDNYPELTVALGMSGTQAPAQEPAPAEPVPDQPVTPETPAAENMDGSGIPKMMSKEGMIKEVAKIVKSFYNRDNPDVGPFRGEEGIVIDVKKKISEMFGEQAGEQAEQMASMFMEKLTQEYQERHGKPVGGDGLSIDGLKEILNRIKGKVEGIGDQGHGGEDFNTNIMSAEEKNPDHSHQYDTTMRHADNPTVQQRMAAHDIKPGVAGYRDRIDMLHDLERTGKVKSESPNKSDIPAAQRKAQGGDWKVTGKDLEKERTRSPTSPEGLAALKAKLGMSEGLTDILKLAGLKK